MNLEESELNYVFDADGMPIIDTCKYKKDRCKAEYSRFLVKNGKPSTKCPKHYLQQKKAEANRKKRDRSAYFSSDDMKEKKRLYKKENKEKNREYAAKHRAKKKAENDEEQRQKNAEYMRKYRAKQKASD